jgi:hypothetical protein
MQIQTLPNGERSLPDTNEDDTEWVPEIERRHALGLSVAVVSAVGLYDLATKRGYGAGGYGEGGYG